MFSKSRAKRVLPVLKNRSNERAIQNKRKKHVLCRSVCGRGRGPVRKRIEKKMAATCGAVHALFASPMLPTARLVTVNRIEKENKETERS